MNLPDDILGIVLSYLDINTYHAAAAQLCSKTSVERIIRYWQQQSRIIEHCTMWRRLYTVNGKYSRFDDEPAVVYRMALLYSKWINIHKHRDSVNVRHPDLILGTDREWYRYGVRHRDNDMPAVIRANGTQEWWYEGKQHRVNGMPAVICADNDMPAVICADNDMPAVIRADNDMPAVIRANGTQEWWYRGMRHREDGPAVIQANGTQEWWYRGKPHRVNDMPAVIRADGTQEWWYEGKQHRDDDMPAVISGDGLRCMWYSCGVLHRTDDKPAVIVRNRDKQIIQEHWYMCGILHRADGKPAVTSLWGATEYYICGKLQFTRASDVHEIHELPLLSRCVIGVLCAIPLYAALRAYIKS